MEDESGGSLVQRPNHSTGLNLITPIEASSAASLFDASIFKKYLIKLLSAVLDAESDDLNSSLFAYPDTHEKCQRFASDSTCMVLYITKAIDHSDFENNQLSTENQTAQLHSIYSISFQLSFLSSHVASIALIKRAPTIDFTKSIASQIQVHNFPGPAASQVTDIAISTPQIQEEENNNSNVGISPYEALHSAVHLAIAPYFEAYVNARATRAAEHKDTFSNSTTPVTGVALAAQKAKEAESKMGIPMAKRRIAELELSLLHLQQNVEIPEVLLNIHPVVQKTIDKFRIEGRKPSIDDIDPTLMTDSSFLNKLQSDVNGWIKEIQKVTKLSRDPSTGTASQEINFWLSMERALANIEDQLKSDQISLTLEILKQAKRFHATVSFIADTGLKEGNEKVYKYNQLMKDFPLDELLSATDLQGLRESLIQIFGHLNKKLKISPYPIRRALPLVEAISRDLNDQLLKVFGSQRIMYLEYPKFEKFMNDAEDVCRTWDDLVKEFTNVAREVTRKRSEKFLPIKINSAHQKLQERVMYIRNFRKQHEQLQQTIIRVMTKPVIKSTEDDKHDESGKTLVISDGNDEKQAIGDIDSVEEVRLAYESVKNVDVLDVSIDGTSIWITAETAYNDRVSRVENQIIAKLRDRLAIAKNANEMFRVFSKFNALFVRPKIRGAIQEYQTLLINLVKEDIKKLHDKFKTQYRHSEAYHMAQLRDIPTVAGTIIWARQIDRQLSTYMKRVEDVLGKGWELYAEGQKLQSESFSFKRKLDTRSIFDSWLYEVNRRGIGIHGRLFEINRNRSQGIFVLSIRFDTHIITLFKEVRNLFWLGFQVPHTVSNIAKDAKRVYPFAVALMETVRTYSQTVYKVKTHNDIAPLVAGHHRDVQNVIIKGLNLRWESFVHSYESRAMGLGSVDSRESRHTSYVREFANSVSLFADKTDALIDIYGEINEIIKHLTLCPYSFEEFQSGLEKIQKLVDRLNLENYSNLDEWVLNLDTRLESVLTDRLRYALRAWMMEFSKDDQEPNDGDDSFRPNKRRKNDSSGKVHSDELVSENLEMRPNLNTLVHEIRIQNQVIFLDPPIEAARASWYGQLHQWLSVICGLRRVQSSRYELTLANRTITIEHKTYNDILGKLKDDSLQNAFQTIESKLMIVYGYVKKWLQFQSLWDLESEYVFGRLGEDLSKWQQILIEIKKTRTTFDNADTKRLFGSIVIDYGQVQNKVNAKYDSWQKDILNRFGNMIGNSMRGFHTSVSKARLELEQHSVETNSTGEAVTFITFVQDLKRKVKKWTEDVSVYQNGQKILERQRFQFPSDWLYVDQIEGEWSAFNEILSRKNNTIQEQISGLQMKIVAEDKVVQKKIKDTISEWEQSKPVQGDIKPDMATNTLNIFEGRISRLKDEYDMVCRAKEALDLEMIIDGRLDPILEELKDLKAVWAALSVIWQSIYEIKDAPWSTFVPRKTRSTLDSLLTSTKEMPSRMHQYAAYEYVQEMLKSYIKVNPIIAELKSEALRERHWRQLFKVLKIEGKFSLIDMTIGNIWDLDVKRNETLVKDVILQAQGEMALEEFLKQVKETWTSYVLDLVNYQNKCRLIRGWDDLFAKCSENLNSLTAMRMSPYYKAFEEEASSWEDKLNRVHVLFDVWIDVQRQWVYLEGIFTGSADIKHLLPVESQRFNNINSEFLTVMKKVYKSPFVLDVLNIQNIQKSLERLADLLGKIQKALGEYLERERSSFPRFYFVGDEDLLEIIGNQKDPLRIMKHFKKMFAGVANIILDDEAATVLGLASREGEEVHFKRPVSIKDNPKINDWLTLLEREMRVSLADHLSDAVHDIREINNDQPESQYSDSYLQWIDQYPAQLVVLAAQIVWTESVEEALKDRAEGNGTKSGRSLEDASSKVIRNLDILADTVLQDLPSIKRKKCEHLITELVHQRDVIRILIRQGVKSPKDFEWLYQMRFYFNVTITDPLIRLTIHMADATFAYGYEYLGVPDRLVQTPLTDRCYLTLTQALENRLGGSPFGPAGTGKTESVKALGVQLGRFVLVFCCDETFDFQAMGRIFVGLCQVGAWGCFDEFNRLEERILSAVSQQVQSIQLGLKAITKDPNAEIELVGKNLKVNTNTGIFITMNPGYAGRSNLPDNLKKLFRSMAMTKPDRELIAQVMLYSQGFRTAEKLASKIVPFFNLCAEQLSPQSHYDFGLRALKSVLVSAGNLKRERLATLRRLIAEGEKSDKEYETISQGLSEQEILIQSVRETIVPKLVADDIPLLTSLLADVFPGVDYIPVDLDKLRFELVKVCKERRLVDGEMWMEKVVQLYQIQNIHHGLMMVGPSGSGKSQAWQVLLAALERVEGVEGISYTIDPKAMSKDALYGTLDPTTREWTDGLFTHILRKIVDNVRGESTKRHWIIFDGDVDPEWVENLNSVLDDNKLLTLPNGERLNLPPNVRIMFEVETLKYATLATVSRCGMVWFSEEVITLPMIYSNYLESIRQIPLSDLEEDVPLATRRTTEDTDDEELNPALMVQQQVANVLQHHFSEDGLVTKALEFASQLEHIMDFTRIRVLNTLFSLLNKTVRNIFDYNTQHPDFPMTNDQIESYVSKRVITSIVWSFSGDAKLELRAKLGNYLREITTIDIPATIDGSSVIDYDVNISNGEWIPWQSRVPTIEIETHTVAQADVVIPTVDTVRHEEVLYSWLSEHKPLMLCGPPGSGKTMTLFSALRKLQDMEVVGLNFSSATTPELILKTFEQYCEYRKTPNGVVLAPVQIGRWLVVFCDEINLPATDKYGTQRVISFLRQLVEYGGYWRTSDKAWVKLERIQFVGACNPPTDPGRVPLSHRFLRHAPLVMVDYPGEISLLQIYNTFARATLKVVPNLRTYSEPLTASMVELYLKSQRHFTPDIQAHYIYSPRELTRWMRGIFEAIRPLEALSVEGLVRIWAHEALRLFQDRLVSEDERKWTEEHIDEVATTHFPTINHQEALARPILFSNWLSKHYVPVNREQLRDFAKARLKVFHEEELDVPLVLFNDVLDHVLRIDRVFRQMQGHLLLIGVSGSGKTTLSRFVAWMNGLNVFQIKVHNKYTGEDFDEDLRTVLRRAGTKGEKICFIMDESNVLDSGFLERMNTLLANAEVPGLFEGDEYSTLMTACKEGAQREGLMLDSSEELYKWFTQQVMKNLHVVFTMNPPEGGLASRAATSPALFNRCVLDWFGDWSDQAFYQVGMEFTQNLDLDMPSYAAPSQFPIAYRNLSLPPTYRLAVVNAFVFVHQSLYEINSRLSKRQGRYNYVTPRHYLDFINHYVKLFNEKREDLEEQQRHLNIGLEKLRDTVVKVEELRKSLAIKKNELEAKNAEANEKLKKMVADQQEAEQKKAASINIQAALEKQNKVIEERKVVVMDDLANAEPAVIEAQKSVSSIKKQQLTEVRSMANPPEAVKMAMESVCTMLGHKIDTWKTVQGILRRDDFIASIVNYDTDRQMTKQLRDKMRSEYLSKPAFNFEVVNRASKACGPLVKWVMAQVNYSEILERVGPLRNEVASLEAQAEQTKNQAADIEGTIKDLEDSIATYKEEYAVLISETQAIKTEMERVKTKVDRSITLLDSLGSEKERWEAGSQAFDTQMGTIVGDVLLSSAFLAYAGYFDQQYRETLLNKWTSHLSEAAIQFKQDLSLTEYLSTADERLLWQGNSLPADDLCTENAIMLKRFNRYPLIIDPSGQATAFLLNEFKERKITVTSFLDDSFIKNLESALRFGNPLLIQDVENLDPILNAVLNKELRRTGGRVLIRLGGQDIDFSPSFMLFLSTRDPSVNFPPDVCSRVTFVNFTVTRSSLQSQCLNQVLKVERPDTDKKRTDLIKLQGEFKLRLRHLERDLLQALNESKGNILDDDTVIDTLERLKKEAADVTKKVVETEHIMQEVEQVTTEYAPLAQACSSIFFVMEQLNLLHHFYQFSLEFFYEIFEYILHDNPNLRGITDHGRRLTILTRDLFETAFRRTSRSLLHEDYITFAMLLCHIKIRGSAVQVDEDEYDFLLSGGDVVPGSSVSSTDFGLPNGLLTSDQAARLSKFVILPCFKVLPQHIKNNSDAWSIFLSSDEAESVVPIIWDEGVPNSVTELRKMLLVKCFRPDRILPAAAHLVASAFERELLSQSDYNFKNLVTDEVRASTPISLCSIPGCDASYRVENLVAEVNAKCISVAMGSQEGFTLADQAIASAVKSGTWVLLKNVHLAPSWLGQLEKRLHSLKPNKNFRLFLTMETNTKVPTNLLRLSRVLMFEPPPGLRANLLECLKSLPANNVSKAPIERVRLYFLLSFLHAVVQERLRYVPLGWTKVYEFNDSDQDSAISTIDKWVDRVSQGRSNIAPEKIPWDALRTLIRESVYGGRIDNEFDQRLLDSFVNNLFVPEAYNIDFSLVDKSEGTLALKIPEGTRLDQFIDWTSKLPEREPPAWLGLPGNAEGVLAIAQGKALLSKIRKMKSTTDDGEVAYDQSAKGTLDGGVQQPAWMRALYSNCSQWLEMLPNKLSLMTRNSESIKNPLFRFFERENQIGSSLVKTVRQDLKDLMLVCEGSLKQTNHLRMLLTCLNKGLVPDHWRRYKVPKALSLNHWIADFALRLDQLEDIAKADDTQNMSIWLGGLFIPEAYVTATRQAVAQKNGWSLEELHLVMNINIETKSGFIITGLKLEGADWKDGQVQLISREILKLGASEITWSRQNVEDQLATNAAKVLLPVYLNSDRSELLFSVHVNASLEDRNKIAQRGVCLSASF